MKLSRKKTVQLLLLIFICAALFTAYILIANKALTVREFEIQSDKIPAAFDGFRIAHVSDLHNESFGKENSKLLEKLESTDPDIIALTGDIIDSRKTDISVAEAFIEQAVKIAPVYYVTGNHEPRIDDSAELYTSMEENGVKILRNKKITLGTGEETLTLYGIDDPSHMADYITGYEGGVVSSALEDLEKGNDFSILLSHRPEFFDIYTENGFDLVLSGHAHGGQFRLPFIGGIFAPGQGFFPEFENGLYRKENTVMLVSRGIGNSVIPVRFNNRPEIIVAILKGAE